MKRILWFILLLEALFATITSCGGRLSYDERLVMTDSLLQDNPDSALAMIDALAADSLTTEGDRAYRDLLLTQARYKAYVTATSDSDINRALAYFCAHPTDREKLTRAYIYKGAVMAELGHPDSAMLYYKHAEATAAPDDYFNQGYSKMRIGELYQGFLSNNHDSAVITRLYEAIKCFKALRDTNYLIVTYGILGAIYYSHQPDSAKTYLNQAITLSQQFNPSLQYTYKSKLSGVYLNAKDYKLANTLAMDIFNNGQDDCYENQYYYYAALSFIKLGIIDSAKYIVSNFPKPYDSVDSMNYYNIMAEISKAENNMESYGKYMALSKKITSKILLSQSGNYISQSEWNFDNKQLETEHNNTKRHNKTLLLLIALLLLSLIGLAIKIKKDFINFEKEKELINQEFETSLKELRISLEDKNSKLISELIGYRLSAIEELYQDIRFKIKDEKKTKKLVPLSSVLSTMNERNELLEVHPSESFWKKMRLSVDGQYNNIISYVEKNYPKLTQQDINILCLLCANVTPQIVKLCMNFSNVRSVSNFRNKLTRKMGLDMSLNEFIDAYMKGKIG